MGEHGSVWIGTGFQESVDHRRAAVQSGEKQGRRTVAVGGVDLGACGDQEVCCFQVGPVRGPMQGGGAVGLRLVDVGLSLNQGTERLVISGLRGSCDFAGCREAGCGESAEEQ